MLLKAIVLSAITVAVFAAPAPSSKGGSNSMIIPLTKRSSLLNRKNVINIAESYVAEHRVNTGTLYPSVMQRDGPTESSGAGVDLTNYKNELWYGVISIGTPAKSFTVQFDTGSSDFFLPTSTGDDNCRSHLNSWDPASSSTSKALALYFAMRFADGTNVSGEQYTDNVTIAGFTTDIQTVGAATTYSSHLALSNCPPDGVLGLGFPSLSRYPASPLFHTLFSEGKLPQPMFSLKLTTSGGELYVGGMNEALYIDSSLAFVPVLTNPGFWALNIDNIKVNSEIVLTSVPAIVDTGANFIYGDESRVLALHLAYGGKAFEDGYYSFPCSSFPSVTFTIGGKPFLIPPNVLNLGRVRPGSRDCFSGIMSLQSNAGSWSLGTNFLKRFYTVFNFGSESPQVGFAKLSSRTS